jgi:hypothetical protein
MIMNLNSASDEPSSSEGNDASASTGLHKHCEGSQLHATLLKDNLFTNNVRIYMCFEMSLHKAYEHVRAITSLMNTLVLVSFADH